MTDERAHGSAGRASDDDGAASAVEIVATVSHELRSPLTSIKGFTSLLLTRWDVIDDDRKREMLEAVRHDADRVTRMVSELLDISRLEAGRLRLARHALAIEPIVRRVIAEVRMVEERLVVDVDIPEGLPEVLADPDKVAQVLTNLVENAAKYADPTEVRVRATVEGRSVRIDVRDRGEGIPPEDLPRVFERFFRRDEGRPTGTGLGLWISRGLVEAHGGVLEAASEPGRGTTFGFTLPMAEPPG